MALRWLGQRWRGVGIACGVPLGFASACHDIVALDCDPRLPVTDACTSDTGDTTSSTTGPSTVTNTSASASATVGTDEDTVAEDSTGIADTGSLCGDGKLDPGEECDDGDRIDIDECDNECRAPECGNGRVQPGEDCDLGVGNDDHGACKLDCSAAVCGDGIVRWGVESCDAMDIDGLSCEAFGYLGGELLCDVGCNFDFQLCSLCPDGMDPCDPYQPCDGECDDGSSCWYENSPFGTCLPPCTLPDDCPSLDGFFADCASEMCVIPCDQDCPEGLLCQPTILYPFRVCLW